MYTRNIYYTNTLYILIFVFSNYLIPTTNIYLYFYILHDKGAIHKNISIF